MSLFFDLSLLPEASHQFVVLSDTLMVDPGSAPLEFESTASVHALLHFRPPRHCPRLGTWATCVYPDVNLNARDED